MPPPIPTHSTGRQRPCRGGVERGEVVERTGRHSSQNERRQNVVKQANSPTNHAFVSFLPVPICLSVCLSIHSWTHITFFTHQRDLSSHLIPCGIEVECKTTNGLGWKKWQGSNIPTTWFEINKSNITILSSRPNQNEGFLRLDYRRRSTVLSALLGRKGRSRLRGRNL